MFRLFNKVFLHLSEVIIGLNDVSFFTCRTLHTRTHTQTHTHIHTYILVFLLFGA